MGSLQLDRAKKNGNRADAQVLIFPALTPSVDGARISYLLSVRQVAEVLRSPNIQPVPFGPRYAEGMAQWRGRVLPVLSLEDCLGIAKSSQPIPVRSIVVRGVAAGDQDQLHESYGIVNVGAAVRHLALPFDCRPMPKPAWVPHASFLSGVYQMQAQLLLALNINRIINAGVSEN